ncbi:acetoin dehydrogenase dihydrolipoyllysine-residue acetyltransferase subunit [Dongia deserti]|uniref:acetoin dehydrogenase dihydrolipoyllysine-residue acetyltransferase subunit n=1 Tax=Dongia deserti TaxID=2268030 RepID=UPI0013C45F67|nr:acetoin dehydrogenase dihydrolipoyllysine-residue acetyltransferase subunit [Dongia deserti]
MGTVNLPLPRLGETMEEGRIVAWLKQPGDKFKRGEILLEVETDKTVVEVPALQDGVMIEHLAAEADMIPVDAPIARIEVAGAVELAAAPKPAAPTPTMAKPAAPIATRPADDGLRASPRARRLARDRGTDLAALTGTGRNGRISGDDVLAASTRTSEAPQAAIQVATLHGTIQVREWPAAGQRRGDAFLIHGLFADADSYALAARRLAKGGLRVLAIDLPGHGGSDATATSLDQLVDATATVLRALAVGPVRLVGHSLGAMVAAKIAAEGEVALERLMLLAPAGLGKEIDTGFIDRMIGADTTADLERELAKLDGGALSPSYLAELLSRIQARRSVLRALAASINDGCGQLHSILADLERVKAHVTAIFGLKDRIIPWQHAAQMPARAAVHFVKNAGHMPHWAASNLVAELLLR